MCGVWYYTTGYFLKTCRIIFFYNRIKNPLRSQRDLPSSSILFDIWYSKKIRCLKQEKNREFFFYWGPRNLDCTGILWPTQELFSSKKKFKMHFVPYKVPYMNSFRNLVNRFIIENPKENCAAENGSGSDSKESLFLS